MKRKYLLDYEASCAPFVRARATLRFNTIKEAQKYIDEGHGYDVKDVHLYEIKKEIPIKNNKSW